MLISIIKAPTNVCFLRANRAIAKFPADRERRDALTGDQEDHCTGVSVSIQPGMPSLLVLDKTAVRSIYWREVVPRLDRQGLLNELKEGGHIKGVTLSNPEPVLNVRTK